MTFDPYQLKAATNGMLPPSVYQAIYETAYNAPEGDILEVGTAHGAATIAMARGMLDAGRESRIITMDKIIGGSRERYGDFATNRGIILDNFRRFHVDHCIQFFADDSQKIAAQLPGDMHISLLMLDADGAIDRDIRLFHPMLGNHARIIIDDYADEVGMSRAGRTVKIDQKSRLTYFLVNHFVENEYLQTDQVVKQTWFGRRTENGNADMALDPGKICGIYRQLTFAKYHKRLLHLPIMRKLTRFIADTSLKYPKIYEKLQAVYATLSKRD